MRLAGRILIAAIVPVLANCDSPRYMPPTAPSTPQASPLPTISSVTGTVLDTASRALPGAGVEVISAGVVAQSTSTDAHGTFSLNGNFTSMTQVRVTKTGYQAAVYFLQPTMVFRLLTDGPQLNLAGSYTLLVEADPACTDLPADFRTRVYDATISAERPGTFYARLGGASFDDYYKFVVLEVADDYVTFDLSDNYILEEPAPETYYAVGGFGGAQATEGGKSISARFDGEIDYCVLKSDTDKAYPCDGDVLTRARCSAKNNRLTLTRK